MTHDLNGPNNQQPARRRLGERGLQPRMLYAVLNGFDNSEFSGIERMVGSHNITGDRSSLQIHPGFISAIVAETC